MKCPACGRENDKLARGGLCNNPECKAPLKIIKKEDMNGNIVAILSFRKPREEVSDNSEVEVYTTTYDHDHVKVEKSNKNNYIVTYYKRANFSWVYCPSCESKMFQNNIINGSIEHKCHKCKAVTLYVFEV